jgi:hypothetical protein
MDGPEAQWEQDWRRLLVHAEWLCMLVQPPRKLPLAYAAFRDSHHGDGRFSFQGRQAQAIPAEEDRTGDEGCPFVAVNERVVLGDSHRVRRGQIFN